MPPIPHLDDSIFHDYTMARIAYKNGDMMMAHHIYKNLRANHSLELFYEVELRPPMRFVHPLGTVLGRADYAPHMVVYQGVSIGSTVDHERPKFTGPCVLFPHSGVIGPVTVGKNVWITAGCIVEARPASEVTIPDNHIVHKRYTADDWRFDKQEPLGNGLSASPTTRSVIDTFFTPRRRATDSGSSERHFEADEHPE